MKFSSKDHTTQKTEIFFQFKYYCFNSSFLCLSVPLFFLYYTFLNLPIEHVSSHTSKLSRTSLWCLYYMNHPGHQSYGRSSLKNYRMEIEWVELKSTKSFLTLALPGASLPTLSCGLNWYSLGTVVNYYTGSAIGCERPQFSFPLHC